MKNTLSDLLRESVFAELYMAELYKIFSHNLTVHKDFWWSLLLEEKNHASVLRALDEYLEPDENMRGELIPRQMQEIEQRNEYIRSLIKDYTDHPPTEEVAFNMALYLEKLCVEATYDKYMTSTPRSKMAEILKDLNQSEIEHEKRIRTYMLEKGIPVLEDPE
ncbi:MAG: hypothetical protein H6868_10320 [Rhodospirillales bacterium]|nr:hypothetical protein [Rhodospirillales bacterium]